MTTHRPLAVTNYLELTSDQRRLLERLPFEGSHLVHGPAGSGKSVLAAHRAAMLFLTGTPVTLLSRSNALRQQAMRWVSGIAPEVEVMTFHSWLNGLFRSAEGTGVPVPAGASSKWDIDWTSILTGLAGHSYPGALVVDEGQDLPPAFYSLCTLLRAQVTVFADENQTITDTNSTLAEIEKKLKASAIPLSGNHRNTLQIAVLADHFHKRAKASGPGLADGPVPTLTAHRSWEGFVDQVRDHLRNQPEQTTAVVVQRTLTQKKLMELFARRGVAVQAYLGSGHPNHRRLDPARAGVTLLTRTSAKGLEFDSVFVPDTHEDRAHPEDPDQRCLYYMLTTRARSSLGLGYLGDREPDHLHAIPERHLRRKAW
ncbi:hypothetical protein PWG71_19250 [Nocardiopsis sp. N85]|uniref:hypothetical protein n=1 Tax=Nocardiopsis sp. N85 TaxID=3029400 RepID=UPI00237F7352|nr:hypothetical protein [Nocardiopsis sp. N85]MDE3723532.1 hypothetical protein [Nocardiopsis sp. N85]